MKSESHLTPPVNPSRAIAGFLFVSLFIFAIAGCVTKAEVEEIVRNSKIETLKAIDNSATARLPGATLPDANGEGEAEPWVEAVGQIEQFIAKHPDATVTNDALRVRQAMLLLTYGQTQLAKNAFDLVVDNNNLSARDQALAQLRVHLIWWFGLNKNGAPEFIQAESALADFKTKIDELKGSPKNTQILDYLAEMRCWIGLHLAFKAPQAPKQKEYLKSAVDEYVSTLTDKDVLAIINGKPANGNPVAQTTRRQIRGLTIIKTAAVRTKEVRQNFAGFKFDSDNSNTLLPLASQ